MVAYVVLANFTEQGIRNAKELPKRAEAFKAMAKTFGVTVREIVWTQGRYDIVTILDAPDELSFMSLTLSLAALGNVRTEIAAGLLCSRDDESRRQHALTFASARLAVCSEAGGICFGLRRHSPVRNCAPEGGAQRRTTMCKCTLENPEMRLTSANQLRDSGSTRVARRPE